MNQWENDDSDIPQTKQSVYKKLGQFFFHIYQLNCFNKHETSAASRCILVLFKWYGCPKNQPQKVLVTHFIYLFHVKTK